MEKPFSSSFESLFGFDLEIGISSSSYSRSMALAAASRSFSSSRHSHHFLDSCTLCAKFLDAGHNIYMYMGNAPFCSEECRKQQIEIDEANERRRLQRKKVAVDDDDDNSNKKLCCSSSNANDLYITVTIAG